MKKITKTAMASLAVLLVLTGAGCMEGDQKMTNQGMTQEEMDNSYESFQSKNLEVTQLLQEASQRQVNVIEHRTAWGDATLKSATDMAQALDDMDTLINELNEVLGK